MRFGYFDDANKEYVIERPDTPRSWTNYLGNTEYGSVITNNAGGYSFYKSGAQGRFLRFRFNAYPMDQPGRYFYLRDRKNGDFWSASWQPVGKDLRKYKSTCRFGTAYAVIDSEYSGIHMHSTYFVPMGQLFEYWLLTVTNNSKVKRDLSVFTYVEFASEWRMQHDLINMQYSQHIARASYKDGIIGCNLLDNLKPDPDHFENADQCRRTFIALAGQKISRFDTDRDVFIAPYHSYNNPAIVERGKCSNSIAYGDNVCGTMQVDLSLKPGESRDLIVMAGIGSAAVEGRKIRREYGTMKRARLELEKVKKHWHSYLGNLDVRTPDRDFNSMVNVWNAYNALITFSWSRAASLVYQGERDGLGFRDTVQDLVGSMPLMTDAVKQRLELMLTGQVANGGAITVVKPFAHRPGHEQPPKDEHYRSDDCLWFFFAVPEYVKETGDMAFYDKVLPFADKGEAPVLGHLKQALLFNLERTGAHGLPCGLDADWNDCLRLGYRGETIFVTFQLRHGLMTYADICRRLGRADEQRWAGEQLAALDDKIQETTWDGKWFVRAYREDGSTIGSHKDAEGSIFLNPQAWAVISGGATPDQAVTAMDSVKRRL
ncbi:N,N'-diacetylchitobiose phosphorylase, partial [bacterium]|nr:N,N'-diacetylchitobiose phosphorylase [bacterium]